MLDLPLFTQYLENTQNVDPLGTAPVNEALYRSVFPGINNAVRFIRIYSAICWMVRQIDETAARTRNPDIAALSAAGLEKIQLLLTWYNVIQGVGALAGANRMFPTDEEEEATLRFDSLLGSAAARRQENAPDFDAGEGAHYLTAPQYRPSLVNGLRFLAASTAVKGTYLLTEAGEALADAYEEAIADHPWRDWLADVESLTVTRGEVLEMGDMLDLLNPHAAEAKAFLDQYYPENGESAIGPHWQQRWAGITLALRALEVEQGNSGASEADIRFAMARGYSRTGVPLNLQGIAEAQGWWANLQLRQYLRLALDTLFRYAQSWVGDAVNSGRPRDISDCAHALGQLLVKALPKEHSQSTGSLIAQLMALKGAHASFYAASPVQPYLQLGGLLDRLVDVCNFSPRSGEAPMALREAYIALVFCALEARNLQANNHIEQRYPNDRLSLDGLQSLLEEFQESSPAEFLEHVVRYYVLLLHFTVVQERTRDGRNRFVLMLGDRGLERVATKDGLGNAGMLQDRLKHALLLLEQCGLVCGNDDGAYVLTPAGRRRLKAVEALDMFEAA